MKNSVNYFSLSESIFKSTEQKPKAKLIVPTLHQKVIGFQSWQCWKMSRKEQRKTFSS